MSAASRQTQPSLTHNHNQMHILICDMQSFILPTSRGNCSVNCPRDTSQALIYIEYFIHKYVSLFISTTMGKQHNNYRDCQCTFANRISGATIRVHLEIMQNKKNIYIKRGFQAYIVCV